MTWSEGRNTVNVTVYDYRHGSSGVVRAFPGGRVVHPDDQNEEEN